MRPFLLVAAFLALVGVSRAQLPVSPTTTASLEAQGMFPFAPPALDDSTNILDLSYLNEKPAGANGFVHVEGEHFVDGNGKPLRFWGVNLNFEGVFPDKETAPKIAGRLAKFGFNAVRLHHYEGNVAPRGLWIAGAIGSSRLKMPREVDTDRLDRMDYFVSQLIEHGIYIDFNLHVAQKVVDGEGFENASALPEKDKGMAEIDERFRLRQQAFARFLLTHVNPYTNRAYKDEPGICGLEVDNESSVLSWWLDGTLNRLPQPYMDNLRTSWNGWLTSKYFSEASWRSAWTEINVPVSGPNMLNPILAPTPTPTPDPNAPQILGQPLNIPPDTAQPPNPITSPLPPSNPAGVTNLAPLPEPSAPNSTTPNTTAPDLSAMQTTPIAIPTTAPEVVAGLDKWKLNLQANGRGTVVRDDLDGPIINGYLQPALNLDLTQAGTASWAFQLVRDGLTLDDNKPYTLTFWARSNVSRAVSVNLWQDYQPFKWLNYTGNVNLTTAWQPYQLTIRASGAETGHVRLSFNVFNSVGNVQFSSLSLKSGGKVGVSDAISLHDGVPIPDAKTEPLFAARRDFAMYLGELEAKNVAAMRTFLRDELGVKVPIWHTQAQFGGWGGVRRELQSDVIDTHIYWKHPDFGGNGWNGDNWRVENQSMAATPLGDPLATTAMLRVPGKPFVVTEYNSGQPNDFGAESLPMLAAFAAWQDWAGAWIFDYHSSGAFDRTNFEGFFSIDTQPVKMATAPLAALLFRRQDGDKLGDVAPARTDTTLNVPEDVAWSEVANTPGVVAMSPFLRTWYNAGGARGIALNGRAGNMQGAGLFPSPSQATTNVPSVFQSDTDELIWDGTRGCWSLNTPRARIVAGFVGGRKMELGDAQFWVMPSTDTTPSANWATIGLCSLDLYPISTSKRLLLTVAGHAENPGMKWNGDRTSVGTAWGNGPSYVSSPDAIVKILTNSGVARVWALNDRGERSGQLTSTLRNGALKFEASPVWRTLWYEIELG